MSHLQNMKKLIAVVFIVLVCSWIADTVEARPRRSKRQSAATRNAEALFDRATNFYGKKDYYSASIELQKLITNRRTPVSVREKAEFLIGRTLYHIGFHAASLFSFDRIIDKGRSHDYYEPTLKWLAALSRVLPPPADVIGRIGKYKESSLRSQELVSVKDDLYYWLGRHHYQDDSFGKAINLLKQIDSNSPLFLKAQFFEGVSYVRQYKGKPAIESFKQILIALKENPERFKQDDAKRYEESALLQMARLFYSTQQYDLAIKYYQKIPKDSKYWPKSLFEASWSYFMTKNYAKALGNIHTLGSPYFTQEFFPEAHLLRAVVLYEHCLNQEALTAIKEYQKRYEPLQRTLKRILDKYNESEDMYQYAVEIRQQKTQLPQDMAQLLRSVLVDQSMEDNFSWINKLKGEIRLLIKSSTAWKSTDIANEILEELSVQLGFAEIRAGQLALYRLERLHEELIELTKNIRRLHIDVLSARVGNIASEVRQDKKSALSQDSALGAVVSSDTDQVQWSFGGGYWKDELGTYQIHIQSQCNKK